MSIADITVYSDYQTSLLKSLSVLPFLLHVWVWVARHHFCFLSVNLSLCHPASGVWPDVPSLASQKITSLLSYPEDGHGCLMLRHSQCFPDFDFCTSFLKWTHHTRLVAAIWASISLLAAPQCDGDKRLTHARWCTLAELYLHSLVAVVWHHACLTTFTNWTDFLIMFGNLACNQAQR